MAEITTTQSFSDGDTVTATKLNNIQANASVQPDAITNRTAETSIDQANDLLLIYDASATALKKVSASNLIKAGTASDFPITGNATIGGTLGVTGTSALTGNTTIGGTLGVTGAITATSTINGTTIPTTKTLVTTVDTQTLTNKTLTTPIISSISNTGTLTLPTATDTIVGRATTDTLTNKTLTTPIISSISNTGTLTLPISTDTLVGRTTTDTLTNKTLTSPVIATITNTGTITLPTSTDTLVGRATTDTLTNKTLTSPSISAPTITGQITASTSIINVGSGQIYKDASGNVGIGITNPSVNLEVVGSGGIRTRYDTSGSGVLINQISSAGDAQIINQANSGIVLGTNNAERLRIASAGQIGIGGANYGTSGQVLTSAGVSTAPSWTTISTTPADGSITALKLNGAQTGSAPIYGIRAWCVFNGTTTGNNAPTAGGNITSVTRNAAGDYTVNFTTNMPSINYAVHISAQSLANNPLVIAPFTSLPATTAVAPTVSAFRFSTYNYAYSAVAESPRITLIFVG